MHHARVFNYFGSGTQVSDIYVRYVTIPQTIYEKTVVSENPQKKRSFVRFS